MQHIITGIKPTNLLHIGNYFGAVEPTLALQEEGKLFMFIADYHAMTVPHDPKIFPDTIRYLAATYLASGVDLSRCVLFQQSQVSAHTELGWILNCVAKMGELERMTQYKDKATMKGENVSVGLFDYPVLMAADILLYGTSIVPVGEDQKQHVELTRDLAIRFNRDFGETFVVPQPSIRAEGARIMGLDDPTKKMSKSASTPKNYISLLDDAETIRKKIKGAVTDAGGPIVYDKTRPGLANLLTIYSLVTKRPIVQIEKDYAGATGYATFKADLAEAIILWLLPLQAKIKAFHADETTLTRLLAEGAEKAREIANRQLILAKKHLGVML